MSSKVESASGKAIVTTHTASVTAWTSKVYDRLSLTEDEIRRLIERFVGAGILTSEDLNRELHAAACWCRDNPVRAGRRSAWYKFLHRWFSVAEEKQRARIQKPRQRLDRRGAPDDADHAATRAHIERGVQRPF